MTDHVKINLDSSGLVTGLSEASREVERIASDQIAPAAQLIEDAFAAAGRSIESSLTDAAARGESALQNLTRSLAKDLGRVAIDRLVRKPIESLITNALSGTPFGGARANGGPVLPRQHYLVGERGPELFTPGTAGRVTPAGGGGVVVNISLPGIRDTERFQQSETQIAAALSRAIGRGQRNL